MGKIDLSSSQTRIRSTRIVLVPRIGSEDGEGRGAVFLPSGWCARRCFPVDGVCWRWMSSPMARVPQWVPAADGAKEDDRAPAEAAAELLAPTNGGGARVSSRTPRSSKARRTKRKSGEDCQSIWSGAHRPAEATGSGATARRRWRRRLVRQPDGVRKKEESALT